MLQEAGGLATAPIIVDRELWIGYKIYIWFLFATFAWATQRLLRVWFQVPPFVGKVTSDPAYLSGLKRFATNIARWLGLIMIGWVLLVAAAIGRTIAVLGTVAFANTEAEVVSVIGDLSGSMAAALSVALLLYLIRWHILGRVERRDNSG